MKTITFTSYYNKNQVNVRIADEKAEQLFNNQWYSPLELYHRDSERVFEGLEPKYFSKGQIKKLDNWLPGVDVWDTLEIVNA